MPDSRRIVRLSLNSVLDFFGCLDAAAETINVRWGGGCSKGTLSKKRAGALDFTVADVIALEDASGLFPVTRFLAKRMAERPAGGAECLAKQSGVIAKESGEAIAAILAAQQSSCADDRAAAVTEIEQAMSALRDAKHRLSHGAGARDE